MIKYSNEEGFIKPKGIKFRENQDKNIKLPKVAFGVFSRHLFNDVVEKFISDLEKNLNETVVLQKEDNKIKVNNEEITFEEKNVGLRSFSVPYFVKNQTIINYNGNNQELKKSIRNIH